MVLSLVVKTSEMTRKLLTGQGLIFLIKDEVTVTLFYILLLSTNLIKRPKLSVSHYFLTSHPSPFVPTEVNHKCLKRHHNVPWIHF